MLTMANPTDYKKVAMTKNLVKIPVLPGAVTICLLLWDQQLNLVNNF